MVLGSKRPRSTQIRTAATLIPDIQETPHFASTHTHTHTAHTHTHTLAKQTQAKGLHTHTFVQCITSRSCKWHSTTKFRAMNDECRCTADIHLEKDNTQKLLGLVNDGTQNSTAASTVSTLQLQQGCEDCLFHPAQHHQQKHPLCTVVQLDCLLQHCLPSSSQQQSVLLFAWQACSDPSTD